MQHSADFHIEIHGMSVEPAVFGHDATRRKSGGLAEDRTGRDGSRCVAVVTIGNRMSSTQMLVFISSQCIRCRVQKKMLSS